MADNALTLANPIEVARDIEAAYRLRANSYIVKPVEFSKFLDVATQIELYWCALNEPPQPAGRGE